MIFHLFGSFGIQRWKWGLLEAITWFDGNYRGRGMIVSFQTITHFGNDFKLGKIGVIICFISGIFF